MKLRKSNVDRLGSEQFDVLIIGGGINGAVSAASLSAKGLKVALIDRSDFASVSSSNSSNLIWGGIKYMESGELMLVNKLCRGRNHLMRHYPSSVKEIRFLTTVNKHFRMPPFLIYLGAILYWLIGACFTKAPRYLSRSALRREEPIINTEHAAGGLEYSDCYLPDNDARFVFKFVRTAMDFGCVAANYVEAIQSVRQNNGWVTDARDNESCATFTVRSKILINACGPYVDHYNESNHQQTEHHHLFSKGIHLVVDRLTEHERVLAFFASDGRLFFVIPMGVKTCIGTTDTQVSSPETHVTEEDREFVLSNANRLLKLPKPLTEDDVIAERCGVRPLVVKGKKEGVADWVKLSRKHAIDIDEQQQLISIFGGKLTDCVNVGEEIAGYVQQLGLRANDVHERWYGEPAAEKKQTFMVRAAQLRIDQFTPVGALESLSQRLWRRYGKRADALLDKIAADPRCATKPIESIEYIRCEIELMAESEMITKLDDFLRRRSKISHVIRRADIIADPGLKEICQLLFADKADQKLNEYAGTREAA